MHRLRTIALLTFISIMNGAVLSAQESGTLRIAVLDTSRLGPRNDLPLLGGISALEWMPANWTSPKSRSGTTLLLFSDHTPNRAADGIIPRTLVFDYDSKLKKLRKNARPFDSNAKQVINAVEALRYAPALGSVFYSYEADSDPWTTGIVRLNKNKKPDSILSKVIPRKMENRGIEAMCIGPDSSLWYCMESGSEEDRLNVEFVRILYDRVSKRHDSNQQSVYKYPFNKCSCLGDDLCAKFNKTLGNGISEMITLPKELGGGFLILERCFDGDHCEVKLFHSDIAGRGVMSKTLVFDFNAAGLKPDNLEGMAWGPKDHGRYVLYVISDDNYNYKSKRPQRTQLIRLSVGR